MSVEPCLKGGILERVGDHGKRPRATKRVGTRRQMRPHKDGLSMPSDKGREMLLCLKPHSKKTGNCWPFKIAAWQAGKCSSSAGKKSHAVGKRGGHPSNSRPGRVPRQVAGKARRNLTRGKSPWCGGRGSETTFGGTWAWWGANKGGELGWAEDWGVKKSFHTGTDGTR